MVSFGTVDVQEFLYSIGIDLVTSTEPPVTLCRKVFEVDLECFEQDRLPTRRRYQDLKLSQDDRTSILQKHGYP